MLWFAHTHVNDICYTCKARVLDGVQYILSGVAPLKESCHPDECVMSTMWDSGIDGR